MTARIIILPAMADPAPDSSAEIESLKRFYAALNRNDLEAMVEDFDPEIERVEPADPPSSGMFRGLEAVKAHIVRGRSTWAEGACEPQRFTVARDRVLVITHVHVRLAAETEWRDGNTGDVFTFRNGKITHFRTFFDAQQAIQWAGAS